MEQWIAPADESDMSSQEGSPRMRRTQRVMVNNKYQIQLKHIFNVFLSLFLCF